MTFKSSLPLPLSLLLLLSLACGGVGGGDGGGGGAPEPASPEVPPPAEPQVTAPSSPPSEGGGGMAAGGEAPSWMGALCQTPQVVGAEDLFREALSTPPGALEGGLLLCDVGFADTPPKGRRWDVFGNPPDPGVALTVGDAVALPEACLQDRMQAVLSWPTVALPVGAKLKLRVQDVDISRHDHAGTDVAIFEGRFPLDLRGDYFRASCRALPRAAVEARLPDRIAQARADLSALRGALRPRPDSADLGFPHDIEVALRRSLEDVAGHVGWSDSRAGGLLSERQGLWAEWERLASATV